MPDRALPTNLDAERFVLGSILLDDSLFLQVAGSLQAEDFALEKHRRIFVRMAGLNDHGEKIDRVTVFNELLKCGEAESCDGLSYLISLDDGLPRISNVDAYVRIVKEKSDLRRVIFTAQNLLDRAMLGQESADDLLSEMASAALNAGEQSGDAQTVGQVIEAVGGMDAYFQRSQSSGLATGFRALDDLTNGLRGGQLFILAARPSVGKTALALNIADHVARAGGHVALFSLEMSKSEIVDRLMAASTRTDSWVIRRGRMTPDDRSRIAASISAVWDTVHIQDRGQCKGIDVHAECRRIQARHGLALVVVDYLQLMSGTGENRNQEISKLSRGLKIAARELDVPFLVLSQLSRASESEKRAPILSDLRDSGAIEQDADIVGFIDRPEIRKPDDPSLKGLADLDLAKHRNGPTGKIPLVFLKQCVRFEARAFEEAA